MFGSEVLEVAIGLSLVFLLISLMCSTVQEAIESVVKTRAMHLERAIREMLCDRQGNKITQKLFEHPLIYSLFAGDYKHDDLKGSGDRRHLPVGKRRHLPSYIPAASFADAFLDLWAGHAPKQGGKQAKNNELTQDTLRKAIPSLPNEKLQAAARSALDRANGDIEATKANLEEWFSATMDRVTGWYKRRTQLTLFAIGLAVAVVLNVDSITITQHLMYDKSLREAAAGQVKTTENTDLKKSFAQIRENLGAIGYPLGWKNCLPAPQACKDGTCTNPTFAQWLQIGIGWLVTALAVMLGAPFWFDILNKFMLLRSTLRPDHHKDSRPSRKGKKK